MEEETRKLEEAFEIEIKEISKSDEEYILSTLPPIKEIKDEDIRKKVIQTYITLLRKSKWEKLEEVPYLPPYMAYGYVYTPQMVKELKLVDHLNTVARTAINLAESAKNSVFPLSEGLDVNVDYVIAGAILHDACRLLEHGDPTVKPAVWSEVHKYFAHGFIGAYVALKVGLPVEIVHAIRSHTSESTTPPRTLEARIVRWADWFAYELMFFHYKMPSVLLGDPEKAMLQKIKHSYPFRPAPE